MFRHLELIPSTKNFGDFAELSLFYNILEFEFSEAFFYGLKKNEINPQYFVEFVLENTCHFYTFYRYNRFEIRALSKNEMCIENGFYVNNGMYYPRKKKDFLIDRCFRLKLFGSASKPFVDRTTILNVEDYQLEEVGKELLSPKGLQYISTITNVDVADLVKSLKIEFYHKQIKIKIVGAGLNFKSLFGAISKYLKSYVYALDCGRAYADFINKQDDNYFIYSLSALNNHYKLGQFKDFALQNIPSVSSIINMGSKSFEDYVKLFKKSEKFKEWLLGLPESNESDRHNLITNYYNEVIKLEWSDKLPSKSVRWLLFTAAGLGLDALGLGGVGTVAGISLGAFDAFLLDNIIKGWKPNMFINEMTKFAK